MASEVLEQNDPIYLTCCSNLALIYKTTGKYEEAIFLYKSVHSSYLELYGPSHKSTIILTHNLAYTYKSRGSPDLAISLLQSLPILSPDTLQSYVLKASCYKDLADYATAKQILTDVEAYIHDTYGKGNVVSVNLLNCKGLVHKNCKEFEEAEKCYKE